MTIFLNIKPTENFSFDQTVYSHGWSELSPFELDEENWRLSYVFSFANDQKADSGDDL